MNFVVTARKWRPQKFSDVVGQEHITSTLKNAIKENRIAHAYLFTGPRGVGKTTTARLLAKALNCENSKDAEPCNKCEMCLSIQNSQSMDIIEIDGASNRGIDEARTLRDSVKYAPTRGKYKIYIIDEVHMLTRESFNAFLKTLEEPPGHTIFIFATTDVHKVPLTIISRCQRYDFRRIHVDEIKQMLKKIADAEKIKIDDATLTIIAKKADGALRDAESYFDQVVAFSKGKINPDTVAQMLNLIDEEVYFKISDAVLEKEFKAVFEVSETLFNNGWDFLDFLEGLTEHYRNILTAILTNSSKLIETTEESKARYLEYVGKYSESDILRLLNFLNKSLQEMRYAQNHKLKTEIVLSHLIGLERTATISDLLSNFDSDETSSFAKDLPKSKTAVTDKPASDSEYYSRTSKKSEIKETPKKFSDEAIPLSAVKDFNFENVVSQWQSFVDEIAKEKGLTLAPALASSKLQSFSGNVLNLEITDTENRNIFNMHSKYIENKSEQFFGKRLKFKIEEKNNDAAADKEKTKMKKSKSGSSTDPYEDIIINELGGEKIE